MKYTGAGLVYTLSLELFNVCSACRASEKHAFVDIEEKLPGHVMSICFLKSCSFLSPLLKCKQIAYEEGKWQNKGPHKGISRCSENQTGIIGEEFVIAGCHVSQRES